MEADYTPEGKDFLSAAGAFFIEGLVSVAEEYPDYCRINIAGGKAGVSPGAPEHSGGNYGA
jgi:hypothetical protein